jgi:hypothetical protein
MRAQRAAGAISHTARPAEVDISANRRARRKILAALQRKRGASHPARLAPLARRDKATAALDQGFTSLRISLKCSVSTLSATFTGTFS